MKKIILLLSLLIIFISLQAQDREPTIMKFTYKINGTTFADVPLNRDSIKPKNFVISTQWGGHPKMLHALKFNYTEDKSTTPKPNTDTNNKINYIWQVNTCTHDLVAPGFIYEPTLTIDSLKPDKFNPKLNDTTKAIWGFRKRLGTVTSDTTNINFDRLVLYHDSANSNPSDKVVLSNSWINNKLYYNGNYYYDSTNHGKHLNFGINLRRLDPTEIRDSTNENDTLLIIRLPYKNKITPTVSIQDTIKFSKLPNTSLIDTIHLNYYENLGTALKTHAVSNINNIVILNKMIPDKLRLDSGYKKDITINAEFKCDNDLINNNPMLKVLGENVGLGIDAIDIEVKYYGKHDIAIDWLSVGTQAFRNVFEGKEDSVVHYYAQKMFQTLSDSGYNVNMVYGTDEHPEDYFNSNRRLLRLFNFNSTIEGAGGAHPKQFAYHEEVKNIWDGSPSFVLACGTPFVRKQVFSNPSFKYRLNYGHGFGIDDVIKDTNNSKYETYLRPRVIDSIHSAKIWRDFHTLNIDSISGQEYSDNTIFKGLDYYNAILKVGFSAQALLEINNYNQFYSGNSHIYDHKAWFQNFYFGGDWHPINYVTGERFSYPQYYRPQTGEESRWNIWRALIYGAKGLTYDAHCEFLFKKRNDTIVDYFGGPKTLQFLNNDLYPNIYDTASVETLLFSNNSIFGTDFIQNPDEATGINYGMNFDSTSNVLGVPKNRIYYGRKSPKIEMYKAHSFIKQPDVENILFKLQIVSAMGKGYRLWHNWDIANYGSNDPMKRILNFDTVHIIYDAIDTNKSLCSKYIRTRPIGRMKDGQAFYEPWDSSFFDLTLHKYNNQNLDTTFVIGLQNRRTDPLIMADFSSYNQMYFSPSAEFEKSVIKGDSIYPYTTDTSLTRVWKDSTWWRNKYWKKLGCREITIPFNFKLQSDTNKYCLLHVKELFDTSSFAVSFRNVTNTKLIDTVIGQDSPLAINFQPGEGKFLEVDVIPPGKLKGKLDNINQNKMVSMPVYRNSILTDSIIHYAVYYNYDSTYQKNKVYLAISQPTNRNDMSANVAWRTPIVISDTAVLFTVFNPTKTVNMSSSTFYDSYHPSITVRKDSNNNHKVYIAYSLFYPVPYIGNCQAIYIMESVYNVNLSGLPVLSSTKVYNKEIGYVYTDGKDYGTPTVNSAKDVLFYAWTGLDTMLRSTLYYSYKTPYQNGINSTQKISNLNGMFSGCSVSLTFLHPSISTYSTTYTKNGFSNYATLVWEQSNCYYDSTIATSQICMTYLKYTSSPTTMFGYFLPSIYKDSRHKDLISFYSDSNIIKFNGIIDKYPSVYTNLSLNNYYVAHQKAFDYITFESSYIFGNAIKIIPILSYEDWDNNWDIGSQLSIIYWGHSPSLTLSQPSIKQPSSLATDIHWKPDSIARVNVNFKMSNSNSESYQFVINEGSKFGYDNETNNIYYSNNYVYSLALVAQNTNQNHLSASPNINMNPTVYKNRRIFETGSNYNTLLTSARYFYKQNANGLEVEGYFGYKTDTTKYYITNITKDNYDLDMKLPFTKEIDTIHGNRILYNNNDSIYSDWFNVSANTLLKFKLFGNGTINSQLSIERQDSVISYPINVSTINSDTLSRLVNIMLINGNNKNYRFLLRRTDTLGIYDEIMAINGIPSADTVNYKTNHSNTKIIDLSGNTTMTGGDQLILSVTPNPAENEVYAIAYIPSSHLIERQAGENKLLLSLYNSIGILIKEVNCVSGETVRFDLRELGNGNYFVKAREKAETFIEECKPVQKSLIIKK